MSPKLHPTDDLEDVGRRVVLATHRRSGTHLTLDLLRRHFPACRARKWPFQGLDSLYLNLDWLGAPWHMPLPRAHARLAGAPRPLVKTHASPALERMPPDAQAFARAVLANADVIAIHRDVRDVLASYHHYERSYAPGLQRSLSEFVMQKEVGVSRPRAWADQVRAWRAAGAHSLAYEQIVADPAGTLERIARWIGLRPLGVEPTLPRPLRSRWQARLRVAFSTDPDATTVPGAAGRPLRWRESLSRADREFIHREAGDLLIELGYEDSDAWVDDA